MCETSSILALPTADRRTITILVELDAFAADERNERGFIL
jgi:hypothetical protein